MGEVDEVKAIIKKHGKQICLVNTKLETWGKMPKYCILMKIEKAKEIKKPFDINKKGFGVGSTWITLGNINEIKI